MKNYFAPEVEILDVMVEQGFAGSSLEDQIPVPGVGDDEI